MAPILQSNHFLLLLPFLFHVWKGKSWQNYVEK